METVSGYPEGGTPVAEYIEKFTSYINDDLDLPKALALAWDLIKDPAHTDENKKATLLEFDKVFGLKLSTVPKSTPVEVPAEVTALAEARQEARSEKDWAKADALRQEIENRGFQVKDTEEGFEIEAL
jgi:cysteinyl-tRNA synthetase